MVKSKNLFLIQSLLGSAILWISIRFLETIRIFLNYGWSALTFPYPVDYGEGQLLDQVARLAHFQPIYFTSASSVTPPFTIANYPPFYQLIQAPFVWAFGVSLWYGRAISLLSVMAACLFVGLIIFALTRDWLAGIIAGLTLLSMPYVLSWSPLMRVDSLALALSLAGLFGVIRWPEGRRSLFVSSILLVLAAYTKQSYALTAPLAAFIWLLSQQKTRRAFELAGIVGGLGVLIFAALAVVTRGSFFFNIVTATNGQFDWNTVANNFQSLRLWFPLMLIGCGLLVLGGLWAKFRPKSWWVVVPYLAGAIIEFITIGKNGSSHNYLFELSAAFGLAAGSLVAWPGKKYRWMSAILIALLATQIGSMVKLSQTVMIQPVVAKFDQESQIAELAAIVREAKGPVLADEYMALIPLANQTIYMQPFEFKQLKDAGIWDDQIIANDMHARLFDVILVYDPKDWDSINARWTPLMQAAIKANYNVVAEYADTLVYRRKP